MPKVRNRKLQLEQLKPRNPLVAAVMRKGVRKHKNRKRQAKIEYVE